MAFPPESWFIGQLDTAAKMNANVRDNLLALNGGGVVPTGLIVLWSKDASLIPSGWALNDGGSGGSRPDLRGRFVVGAGNLYVPGDAGGAATVTPATHTQHVITQPSHADHVTTGGAHTLAAADSALRNFLFPAVDHTGNTHNGLTMHDSGHDHANAAVDNAGHAHAAMAILPPWRALAYMQKASSGLSFTTPRTWTPGEVPNATMFNAELRDNPNYLLGSLMPLGVIIIWGGGVDSIPSGWQLCDGSNGTPDMRDKFVIGAGGAYTANTTGGSATATLAAHLGHTPTQADAHADHTASPSAHPTISAGAFSTGSYVIASETFAHSGFSLDSHSAHSGFALSAHSGAHQVGGAAPSIIPPYFALAYIQLVSLPTPPTPRTWTNGDNVQADEFDTYIRDVELAILAAQFPLAGIGIWSGTIATIPPHYALEIPDVFVPGAGGIYPVAGAGGGSGFTLDPHGPHSVTQAGAHTNHTVLSQPSNHTGTVGVSPLGAGDVQYISGTVARTHTDVAVNAHSAHAFTADGHSAHAPIADTRPPYFALAFVQRTT